MGKRYESLDGLLENKNHTKYNEKHKKGKIIKKKINRGKKKRAKETELCIISANAAQLKKKLKVY